MLWIEAQSLARSLMAQLTEGELLEDTTKFIKLEFAEYLRTLESAVTMVDLFTAVDQSLENFAGSSLLPACALRKRQLGRVNHDA